MTTTFDRLRSRSVALALVGCLFFNPAAGAFASRTGPQTQTSRYPFESQALAVMALDMRRSFEPPQRWFVLRRLAAAGTILAGSTAFLVYHKSGFWGSVAVLALETGLMIANATIKEPPVPVLRHRVDMEAYGRAQGYRPEWDAEHQTLTFHLPEKIMIEIQFSKTHADITKITATHNRGDGWQTQSETAWSPEMAKAKKVAAPVGIAFPTHNSLLILLPDGIKAAYHYDVDSFSIEHIAQDKARLDPRLTFDIRPHFTSGLSLYEAALQEWLTKLTREQIALDDEGLSFVQTSLDALKLLPDDPMEPLLVALLKLPGRNHAVWRRAQQTVLKVLQSRTWEKMWPMKAIAAILGEGVDVYPDVLSDALAWASAKYGLPKSFLARQIIGVLSGERLLSDVPGLEVTPEDAAISFKIIAQAIIAACRTLDWDVSPDDFVAGIQAMKPRDRERNDSQKQKIDSEHLAVLEEFPWPGESLGPEVKKAVAQLRKKWEQSPASSDKGSSDFPPQKADSSLNEAKTIIQEWIDNHNSQIQDVLRAAQRIESRLENKQPTVRVLTALANTALALQISGPLPNDGPAAIGHATLAHFVNNYLIRMCAITSIRYLPLEKARLQIVEAREEIEKVLNILKAIVQEPNPSRMLIRRDRRTIIDAEAILAKLEKQTFTITTAPEYQRAKPEEILLSPGQQRQNRAAFRFLRQYAKKHDLAMQTELEAMKFHVMEGLASLELYDPLTHSAMQDSIALGHPWVNLATKFHALRHAVINAKMGVPSTDEERNVHEAVITYEELQYVFTHFEPSSRHFLNYLTRSPLNSESYVTLMTDLRAQEVDWTRPETGSLLTDIAAYVLGRSPSPDFVAHCLALLDDLRWERLLTAMNAEPLQAMVEVGRAMNALLQSLEPVEEFVIREHYLNKKTLWDIGRHFGLRGQIRVIHQSALNKLRDPKRQAA